MRTLLIFVLINLIPVQEDILGQIDTAMKAGSAKGLISFCNKTVEIKMEGKTANYSKSQAEVLLKDFFDKNSPESFEYIHRGTTSTEGLKYTIGKYIHENGSYRVVMLIKKIGADYKIDAINFSKE